MGFLSSLLSNIILLITLTIQYIAYFIHAKRRQGEEGAFCTFQWVEEMGTGISNNVITQIAA